MKLIEYYACLHRVWIFASLDLVKPIIIVSCSCQLRNEEGTEAEMCPTVVSYSGVITGGGRSSIGHFSLSLVNSLCKSSLGPVCYEWKIFSAP